MAKSHMVLGGEVSPNINAELSVSDLIKKMNQGDLAAILEFSDRVDEKNLEYYPPVVWPNLHTKISRNKKEIEALVFKLERTPQALLSQIDKMALFIYYNALSPANVLAPDKRPVRNKKKRDAIFQSLADSSPFASYLKLISIKKRDEIINKLLEISKQGLYLASEKLAEYSREGRDTIKAAFFYRLALAQALENAVPSDRCYRIRMNLAQLCSDKLAHPAVTFHAAIALPENPDVQLAFMRVKEQSPDEILLLLRKEDESVLQLLTVISGIDENKPFIDTPENHISEVIKLLQAYIEREQSKVGATSSLLIEETNKGLMEAQKDINNFVKSIYSSQFFLEKAIAHLGEYIDAFSGVSSVRFFTAPVPLAQELKIREINSIIAKIQIAVKLFNFRNEEKQVHFSPYPFARKRLSLS